MEISNRGRSSAISISISVFEISAETLSNEENAENHEARPRALLSHDGSPNSARLTFRLDPSRQPSRDLGGADVSRATHGW